jgi:glycosyltransferase involved in cell wall biosynthesis
MKVAQISPAFFSKDSVLGGGERYVLELSRHLSQQAEVTLITFSRNADRLVVKRDGQLEIRHYPARHFVRGNLANPASIAFAKDLRRFDVLHCYGYPQVITDTCIAFSKLFRKPLFVTDTGGGGACLSSYLSRIGVDTRRFVRQFLLFSAYSAKSYTRFHRRVRVIYGGVNTEFFRPLGVARSSNVLFVGRLISAKGVNYLIEGLDATVALRVIGQPSDEPYYRLLQSMARGKTVEFLTEASDGELVREYSSALVTVVPSVLTDVHGNSTTGELLSLSAL